MQLWQGMPGIHPYHLGNESQPFGHDSTGKNELWQCHIQRNPHHGMLDLMEYKK